MAVRNYQTRDGRWQQTAITPDEQKRLDAELREEHFRLLRECVEDAKAAMDCWIPDVGYRMAIALFERRALHVSAIYEEFIQSKVARLRDGQAGEERQDG